MNYHLAQLNIAKMISSVEDPRMKDFNDALDTVNAIADATPGFVWRLQSDQGNAVDFDIYDDPNYLVNMSVWESLDALREFVTDGQHLAIMKRRAEWFEKSEQAYMVFWWIPAGHIPTIAEAQEKLDHLRENGPCEYAFNFSNYFPPPEQ